MLKVLDTKGSNNEFLEYIWSQEEPRNAGCWSFVKPRFLNGLGINVSIKFELIYGF